MKLWKLILFGLTLLSVSCEGFKILKLHNFSNTNVEVTIKPGTNTMKRYELSNYPNTTSINANSVILELPKDSSLVLTSIFTSFLRGAKIKEQDIRINYLKIKTIDTTIIADSKREIINLLKEDSFKYKKNLDRERELINSRNWRNIIIKK